MDSSGSSDTIDLSSEEARLAGTQCAPLATPEQSLSEQSRRAFQIPLPEPSLDDTDSSLQEALSRTLTSSRSVVTSTPRKDRTSPVFSDVLLNSPVGQRVPRTQGTYEYRNTPVWTQRQTQALTSTSSLPSQGSPPASQLQHAHCPLLQQQNGCVSGNASVLSSNSVFCRICHEGACKEDLVSPCRCTGTMGKIHITCAERWLSSANTSRCEICGTGYLTKRKPKPFCEWLREPANPSDKRNLVGDVMCFFLLTPLAVISDWLCISGAAHYSLVPGAPQWQIIGLVVLAVFLAIIYFVWCIIAVRYHVKIFHAWQRHNQVVKIVNDPPSRPTGRLPICALTSCASSPCLTNTNDDNMDDNNNIHNYYTISPSAPSPIHQHQDAFTSHQTSPSSPPTQESSIVVNLLSTPGGRTYGARQTVHSSTTTVRLVRETVV